MISALQSIRKPVSFSRVFTSRMFRSFSIFMLMVVHGTLIADITPDMPMGDQELVYAVSYGNRNVGNIEISIQSEKGGYQLGSITKPTRIAGLLLKEHTSDTRFIWRNEALVLHSAVEKLEGKKSYDRGFTFDFDTYTIELAEGKTSTFKEGDQFESVTFPLLLMHRDVNSIGGLEVREVSPKRLRSYTYEAAEEETVNVPAGEFTSWKITRFRSDRPEDTVTVWLNQADNPIPLKIEVSKGGKVSILALSKT